jgi:hypothetical protein
MLSLATARRPHWQVKIDWLDRPTIVPSVWQTDGCFSHFWVKAGRIDWVKDTGRPPSRLEISLLYRTKFRPKSRDIP